MPACACLLLFGITLTTSSSLPARETIPLGDEWHFQLGDFTDVAAATAAAPQWPAVPLPHDWAFQMGYAADNAQTDKGGYMSGGIGWYQHTITAPASWAGQEVMIEFDGVYMNSEVWLNGVPLGKRPYGYISFAYDLTPHLKLGTANTLMVRVDNSREPSARWGHPCGIYAPVRLIVSAPTHVARHGIYVRTTELTAQAARITVEYTLASPLAGSGKIQALLHLRDPQGKPLETKSPRIGVQGAQTAQFTIAAPQRWDLDTPHLYTVEVELRLAGQTVDQVTEHFGLRTIRWETATGFWLNDRNVKLRGVAEHLEGGPVGGGWPEELIEWKIRLLKAMGVNAIRTAHNPQVPYFYEVCDRLGMLVMDEALDGWMEKAEWDYGRQAFAEWWKRDLQEWLVRSRNHPSIVIRSVGNETRGAVGAELVAWCHQFDPERPVTSGHSAPEDMDVDGVNGASEKMGFFEHPHFDKPFVATEAPHTWQVRGYYRTQSWFRDGFPNRRQQPFPLPDLTPREIFHYDWINPAQRPNQKQIFNSSYDNAMVRITARQNWELMRDRPWFSGHFRWTGFDYPGEAGYVHGGWPFRAFMGGALDLAGFEKDMFYFYQSQWTTTPMVHLLPSWTHPTMRLGTEIPVWAYSNADEVELILNGRSLGRDRPGTQWNEMQCEWLVPWEPGTLEAIAYRQGEVVARDILHTASHPAALLISTEDAPLLLDNQDTARVTIDLADQAGTPYPYGENRVYLHATGPVGMLSLESGNPVDTETNYRATDRRAFFGRLRAFYQATGAPGDVTVVVGAILGERQQLTSPLVAIDLEKISLRGPLSTGQLQVTYTTDGSPPTPRSTPYTAAFPVPLGTTVRALVRSADGALFTMEESFAADAGLYWGDGSEVAKAHVGLQAEDAEFTGGEISDEGDGHHGTGFVRFPHGTGTIRWYQENDGDKGQAAIAIRYASGAKHALTMDLFNNGQRVETITFPPTQSWTKNWATIKRPITITNGANWIELRVQGEAPNIDELLVIE